MFSLFSAQTHKMWASFKPVRFHPGRYVCGGPVESGIALLRGEANFGFCSADAFFLLFSFTTMASALCVTWARLVSHFKKINFHHLLVNYPAIIKRKDDILLYNHLCDSHLPPLPVASSSFRYSSPIIHFNYLLCCFLRCQWPSAN